MLHQILIEFEIAAGPINLNELARKLGVDRSALDGMIQFWVRKGRIEDSQLANSPDLSLIPSATLRTGLSEAEVAVERGAPSACSSMTCASSCSGPQGCPYVMKMPRTFSLIQFDDPTQNR